MDVKLMIKMIIIIIIITSNCKLSNKVPAHLVNRSKNRSGNAIIIKIYT